jgi:hypothetical protein
MNASSIIIRLMKAEDFDAVVGIDRNDSKLTHFFSANQFGPSQTINLERSL